MFCKSSVTKILYRMTSDQKTLFELLPTRASFWRQGTPGLILRGVLLSRKRGNNVSSRNWNSWFSITTCLSSVIEVAMKIFYTLLKTFDENSLESDLIVKIFIVWKIRVVILVLIILAIHSLFSLQLTAWFLLPGSLIKKYRLGD